MNSATPFQLRKPIKIIAKYRVVTPLFLGGYDSAADIQNFRNSSLKGALRFWWRALHWSTAYRDSHNNIQKALSTLHEREGKLFGLVSDGDARQSNVFISSELSGASLINKGEDPNMPAYLLGQGLYHFKTKLTRNAIKDGELTVTLTLKNINTDQQHQLENSLIALGIFGGLGSRSRKGVGSLAIDSITRDSSIRAFNTIDDVKHFIEQVDLSAPPDSPISAFNAGSRIDWIKGKSVNDVHKTINDTMQLYRSFGLNEKVLGQRALRLFKDDHDLIFDYLKNNITPKKLPRRTVFGLPHNYRFSSLDKGKNSVSINVSDGSRRASPLFIHIHSFPNSSDAWAIQTYLGGAFLPKDLKVNIASRAPSDQSVDANVIYEYLNFFKDFETIKRG